MQWKSYRSLQLVWAILIAASSFNVGCKRAPTDGAAIDTDSHESSAAHPEVAAKPAPIRPPFEVSGELEGLLLVWFDADGLHTAQKRSEIPEAQRSAVRIDSLNVEPDARLDPDHVYVADLRNAGKDGSYPVQKASRAWFDAQVDRAKPQPPAPPANEEASVIVYKASWCGACKSAAAYLRSRHVQFIEKDVEKEPGASEEMQRKAQAKGLRPRGVPVIDFRGEIMLGFDQARLSDLIDRYAKAI